MSIRVQFMKDKAGTLEFYCPEGRADADGDVYVYTSGTSQLDATNLAGSSNAIRDTVSTTMTGTEGDETFTLGSATGVTVGRRYLVTNEEGRIQDVTLIGLDSTTARIDAPLRFTCAAGSTFTGHRITVALTTTHTASIRRRMRALWEYDVNSVTYRHSYFFDVVRLPFSLDVDEYDIEVHDPGFGERVGNRRGWLKLLEGAKADIWNALDGMQVYPDLVRDVSLIKTACVYRLLQKYNRTKPELRDYYGEMYTDALSQFQDSKAWYDSDDDLSLDSNSGGTLTIGTDEVYDTGMSNEIVGGETIDELGLPVQYARVG